MKYRLVTLALFLVAGVVFLTGLAWLQKSQLFGALLMTAAAVCEVQAWKRTHLRRHKSAK